jgi:hypothetical protein
MRLTKLALLSCFIALGAGCAAGASAEGGGAASTTTATTNTSATAAAQRAIAEADIIQVQGGLLYAMSKSGTVSIVDVSTPGVLILRGQTTLQGQPFEMYLRGSSLVVMSNAAVGSDGTLGTSQTADEGAGAIVGVLDVHDPANPAVTTTLKVPGEIADSRFVGDVLYLASYENAACYGCGPAPRTMVTTFDVADPTAMKQVEQVSFESNAPDGYNLPWGQNWKRSIFVTDTRLYIGGHADIDPNTFGTAKEGIIDVLDITDPTGRLVTGAHLVVAGAILSRWQIDETNGVLRVISQVGAGRTGNGLAPPEIATFRVDSAQSFTPLGTATMTLPMPEGLRTVRFDGARAYAITYNQTDPMFVIDLSDPTAPRQQGALFMPGFMYYLEPHGDRVIGLGIDRTDPNGSLNVSLFDVSNASAPRMISRVAFGTAGITEDYLILNGEVSEDQDRIQKAFQVFSDGLVVVPFSTPLPYYDLGSSCANEGGGVQLVSWQNDTLTKHVLLPLPGNPRRAFEEGTQMITVSDSNVRAFALADVTSAHETADLVIGACTSPAEPTVSVGNNGADYQGGGYSDGPPQFACAATGDGGSVGWRTLLAVLGALAAAVTRRRRAGRPAIILAQPLDSESPETFQSRLPLPPSGVSSAR